MSRLKVCLVGVGGISSAHIAAWDSMEDVELTALCDIRKERLERYPEKHHYLDCEEMLRMEQPDILDICLPTYLHADYAVKAMEQGIHVLCEKPISLKEEDVDRVYKTARDHQVCFMVAQVLRFWPEYELVKDCYDTKRYGKLLSGTMSRLGGIPKWSWDGWMQDENRSGLVPFDLHIHDLDFIVYAFGIPQRMETHRSKRPEQDYLHNIYECGDAFISAEASWYAAPYPFQASFRFQFEQALLTMEGGKCILYENNGNVTDLSEQSEMDTGTIHLPRSNAYANEIRYFADCVQAGHFPDRVKPEELKSVIRILQNR